MSPLRGFVACLAFLALVFAAPVSEAQMGPCGCGYSMHVQQFHIRMQSQQNYMMQMQQMQMQQMQMARLQMQQMRMHQQHAQLRLQQQQVHMQMGMLHQQRNRVTTQHNLVTAGGGRMTAQTSKVWLTHGRGSGQPSLLTAQTSRTWATASKLTTQHSKVTTQQSKVGMQLSKLSTQQSKVGMQQSKVGMQQSKVTAQVGKVYAQTSKGSKTVNCSKDITVTVVTFDMNCGQCHTRQTPTAITQGPGGRFPAPLQTRPMPNILGTPQARLPQVVNSGLPRFPNMMSRPQGRPDLPQIVGRRPTLRLPNFVGGPPAAVVLREPLGPGARPGVLPYGLPVLPSSGPAVDLWALPGGQPADQPERPAVVTRRDPTLFGTTRTTSTLKKSALTAEIVTARKPAVKELVEGITDGSQPLPTDVLQAPAPPTTQAVHSELGIAQGGGPGSVEGIIDPTHAGAPAEGAPAALVRSPLSAEELQSPALPELPASILLPPPETDWTPLLEDADADFDRPAAPEAPEFTPRVPDPVAGLSPRQASPVRLVADNPLGAPALPNDPTAPAGGG